MIKLPQEICNELFFGIAFAEMATNKFDDAIALARSKSHHLFEIGMIDVAEAELRLKCKAWENYRSPM